MSTNDNDLPEPVTISIAWVDNGTPFEVTEDSVSAGVMMKAQQAVAHILKTAGKETADMHAVAASYVMENARVDASLHQAQLFVHDVLAQQDESVRKMKPQEVLDRLKTSELKVLLDALGLRQDKPKVTDKTDADEEQEGDAVPSG